MTLIEKLQAFNEAGQSLSSAFDKASDWEKRCVESSYLEKGFNMTLHDLSYEIHRFCEDAEEFLITDAPVKYAICKLEHERVEKGYVMKARVYEEGNVVSVVDETGREGWIEMTFEEYQNHFFEIPSEMYALLIKFSESDDVGPFFDLREMAEFLYNRGDKIVR